MLYHILYVIIVFCNINTDITVLHNDPPLSKGHYPLCQVENNYIFFFNL